MDERALVDALAATPTRLRDLFEGVDDDVARRRPSPDAWSAVDVLTHLRACDAIVLSRVPQILVRPGLPLPGLDEVAYGRLLRRAEPSVAEQMQAFAARRAELVALLEKLAPDEWGLAGRHEELGDVSIRRIIEHAVAHEAEHVAQVEAVLP